MSAQKIAARCSWCSAPLDVIELPDGALSVEPCDACLSMKQDDGYDAGYERGYGTGYAAGREVGSE